jgi:hypothetical protein
MGCQKTMSDFEKALISALEEAMPWAEVIYLFLTGFCMFMYSLVPDMLISYRLNVSAYFCNRKCKFLSFPKTKLNDNTGEGYC